MAELKILNMDEIPATEVGWLWYPYIPYGKITIVHGDPGDGNDLVEGHVHVDVFQVVDPGPADFDGFGHGEVPPGMGVKLILRRTGRKCKEAEFKLHVYRVHNFLENDSFPRESPACHISVPAV